MRGSVGFAMCRNIRPLFNFEPPSTSDDVRAAALQFVRKISGSAVPSKANEPAFATAVDAIAAASSDLLASLQTRAPVRDRAAETEKAKMRGRKRDAISLAVERAEA